jgi:hypothetical protein
VIVVLGKFAYDVIAGLLDVTRPRPRFGHGVEVAAGPGRTMVCSFHPSQQNTFTGKLTVDMLDALGPMMIMLPRARLGGDYSLTDATHVDRVDREHDNIAAAVLAGDADTARAAMRVHLGNTRRRLTSG